MATSNRPQHPARQPSEPWTAETLAAELRWLDWSDEPWRIISERRLTELEHALISGKARRRLRRELRQSAARFAWAGGFAAARTEDLGNEALCYWDIRAERAA